MLPHTIIKYEYCTTLSYIACVFNKTQKGCAFSYKSNRKKDIQKISGFQYSIIVCGDFIIPLLHFKINIKIFFKKLLTT